MFGVYALEKVDDLGGRLRERLQRFVRVLIAPSNQIQQQRFLRNALFIARKRKSVINIAAHR